MLQHLNSWISFKKRRSFEIAPDEVLLDSSNLPNFDKDQFEGRLEVPLAQRSFIFLAFVGVFIFVGFIVRAATLQIIHGVEYADRAQNNQLSEKTVFADRGIIFDRNGVVLAGNIRKNISEEFATRSYSEYRGVAHVVGYVKPPTKDSSGSYFRRVFEGMDGLEKKYSTELSGTNGLVLSEVDARGKVVSESVIDAPVSGKKIVSSIDAKLSEALYDRIQERVKASGYEAGAGVIMDVNTGELIAMVSYPEYSSSALSAGDSDAIKNFNTDIRQPFLDRVTDGLYAPGSIVKPIMAIAALTEGVIDENKKILSTGSISLPNPYNPSKPSLYRDWKAHGWVDMRSAIANSSDVYFYEVGGGYQTQKGMGIYAIEKYLRLFGFGESTALMGNNEPAGSIPSPEWKEKNFPGDPWRVGDTYHTVIGQYGTTITPLQAVRAIAAVANNGKLLTPTLLASSTVSSKNIALSPHVFTVAKEGMRMAVEGATAQAVNFSFVHVAGKTGTAQIGTKNQFMNSWVVGFFPYESPRYAFAVVLQKAPAGTNIGAPAVMGSFIPWVREHAPYYLEAPTEVSTNAF